MFVTMMISTTAAVAKKYNQLPLIWGRLGLVQRGPLKVLYSMCRSSVARYYQSYQSVTASWPLSSVGADCV